MIRAVLNELEPFEVEDILLCKKRFEKLDLHRLLQSLYMLIRKTAPILDRGRLKRTRDIRRLGIISYYVKDVSKNCINIDSTLEKLKMIKRSRELF